MGFNGFNTNSLIRTDTNLHSNLSHVLNTEYFGIVYLKTWKKKTKEINKYNLVPRR